MISMKNKNAITLVALSITIIILLLLAAVVIQISFGENGLITKASSTNLEQAKSELYDIAKLEYLNLKSKALLNNEQEPDFDSILSQESFSNKYNIIENNITDKKGNIIDTKANLIKVVKNDYSDMSSNIPQIPIEDKDKLILRINVRTTSNLKLTLGNQPSVNVELDKDSSKESKHLAANSSINQSLDPGTYIMKLSLVNGDPSGINYLNDLQVNILHSFASVDIINWGTTNSTKLILASIDKVYAPEPDLVYVIYDSAVFKKIPNDLFKNKKTNTNISRFFNCPNITEIPEDLYKNCINAKNFMMVFFRCKKIESIPENLFKYNINATNFNNAFTETKIKSIPENLFANNTKINDLSFTFKNCNELTSIPQNIINNAMSATRHSGTFNGCTSASNYSTLDVSLK